jgi:DNA-binding SARP family transcriptional activator
VSVAVKSGLDFRVLGPLRVLNDGIEIPLGGEKPRAVLALLLTHRNRLVSTDVFAEEIWSKGTEQTLGNLQVVIGKLRKSLATGEDQPSGQRCLTTSGPGYTIRIEDQRIDLARFQQHRSVGDAARAARRPADAATAYRRALAEWSGSRALEDLVGCRFADAFAEGLAHELIAVRQQRIEAELALGRHAELVGELSTLTREHPFNDILRGQLITALSATGNSDQAAEQYHQFRERYQTELGSAVPETLRMTWAAISRHALPPDHYAGTTGPGAIDRTLTDERLASLRAELVRHDGTRIRVSGRFTMGRAGCDVTLPDAKVSKQHAVLSPTPDGYTITDLQSTNGTFVNDVLIAAPTLLTHLDRIRMGDTELVLRMGSTADP